MSRPWRRIRARFTGTSVFERELDDELASTVAELAAEGEAKGLSPAEARRRALVELGGIDQVKESVREVRRGARADAAWRDLRHAFRTLRRSPGFAVVAIATLALGLGGTTAIFSVARAALATPAYPEADRLVHVKAFWPGGFGNFAYPDFVAMTEGNRSFEKLAAYEPWGGVAMSGREGAARLETSFVTADYFELVGARAALGRLFAPGENRFTSSDPVAVVSDACWRRELGADPGALGRPIRLNGTPFTLIGVLERGYRDLGLAEGGVAPDVYLPAAAAPALLGQPPLSENYGIYWGIARLKRGVEIAAARANLAEVAAVRAKQDPANREGHGLDLQPLVERTAGPVRAPALLLLAGAGLILLLGCVNLANASLVRLERRRPEMAMRAALGATPGHLARQLLFEAALITTLGGAAGIGLALLLTRALAVWVGAHVTALVDVRVDGVVLGGAFALTLATALIFGVAPALAGRRVDLRTVLARVGTRSAGPGRAGSSRRRTLVVVEVALATVLLVAAGLMARSVARLLAGGIGFDTSHLLTLRADLTAPAYAEPAARARFGRVLVERLETTPGVRSATLWGPSMLSNATWVVSLFPADREPAGREDFVQVFRHSVDPDGLANLGIPLLAGRPFDGHDDLDAPLVAIVSESVARRFWPGEPAVGKRLRRLDPALPPITVVGVAADARHRNRYSLDDAAAGWPLGGLGEQRDVYLPYAQRPNPALTLALRISGEPAAVIPAVRESVAALDAGLPLSDVRLLDDRLAKQEEAPEMIARLLGGFAAFSLLLAALGVYGVVAQSVEVRAKEIGVRLALGESPGAVARRIISGGAALALAGFAAGSFGAFAVGRLMRSLLFEVGPVDPPTWAAVGAILLAVTILTSWLPAQRVLRRGALGALREE